MRNTITLRDVLGGLKMDAFTTRLFVDPLAIPLTLGMARLGFVTPNGVTLAALVLGLGAAVLFARGHAQAGALGYYLFFLFDCIDGKLARVTRQGSATGAVYDFAADRTVAAAMSLGLAAAWLRDGTMAATGLVVVYIVLFLLKDVLTLLLRNPAQADHGTPDKGFLIHSGLKMHFRPGQVLSCFAAFFLAPLTGHWQVWLPVAILCVLISLLHNVVIPLIRLKRSTPRGEPAA
jgi:phosphatidylglycerophosphate synthase